MRKVLTPIVRTRKQYEYEIVQQTKSKHTQDYYTIKDDLVSG